tara:strand:- start:810 stop:3530 length:2721 start_codon:yes stop_codon:yes gene_type:complete
MTNSGLQWASPETPKQYNTDDQLKLKTFTDLTTATGQATKDAIKAHDALTKSIINSIDTGEEQRKDIIDFYTNLAPKAAGQAVSAYKNIKEARKEFRPVMDVDEALDDPKELVRYNKHLQHDTMINDVIGRASAVTENQGDIVGALSILDINDRSEKKEILNKYINEIRPSVHETMSDTVFKIGKKEYTLNSTDDPNIELEIRKRIDIAIAANAYRTGKFGKNEIVYGILIPAKKDNKKKFLASTAALAVKNKQNLLIKRRKNLIEGVRSNDPLVLENHINNLLLNASNTLSRRQIAEGTVEDLVQLAEIGADKNGLDPLTVRNLLLNSEYKNWNGNHASIIDAFNKNADGKGSEWLAKLDKIIVTNFENKETALKATAAGITEKYIPLLLNAGSIQAEQEIVNQLEQEIRVNKSSASGARIDNYLSQDIKAIRAFGGLRDRHENQYKMILAKYRAKKPVLQSDLDGLAPEYINALDNAFELKPWNQQDTLVVTDILKKGLLRRDVLKAVFKTSDIGLYQSDVDNLEIELLEITAGHYNEYIKNNNHETALRLAAAKTNSLHTDMIKNALKRKATKEDISILSETIIGMAQPGIGDVKDIQTLKRIHAEKLNFIKVIKSNNDLLRNYTLFNSEDKLIGEDEQALTLLSRWNANGGIGKLPDIYKQWSAASGIPVERIALYRLRSLSGEKGVAAIEANDEFLAAEKITIENINNKHPSIDKLIKSKSAGEANAVRLNSEIINDENFITSQLHPLANEWSSNNESVTAFDFMQVLHKKEGELPTEKPITKTSIKDLYSIFKEGDYYNIGGFGIPDEPTFKLIASSLLTSGHITLDTVFDQETQKLFYRKAAAIQSQKIQLISGIQYNQTQFNKEQLEECGLGNTEYNGELLEKNLTEFCKKNYKSKTK